MAPASHPATGNGISVRQFCPLFIVQLPDQPVRKDLSHLLVVIKGSVKMFLGETRDCWSRSKSGRISEESAAFL